PEVRPSLVEGRDCISGKMNVAASPANYVRCMATDPDTDWWLWGAARGHGRFQADRDSPAPLSLSPSLLLFLSLCLSLSVSLSVSLSPYSDPTSSFFVPCF